MDSALAILSLTIFLPAVGAILLLAIPSNKPDALRLFTLGITIVVFLLTIYLCLPAGDQPDTGKFSFAPERIASIQNAVSIPWIPSFNIHYFLGLDGISLPLVVLTAFVAMLAMAASWSIEKYVKAYCILYLLLLTGMIGVFLALDFFLFYVFWEVMLLPMYFLIGVWGGPRREYAAIKFFLYTLVGSVLMLIAILMLYFASDLRQLNDGQLVASHAVTAASPEAQTQAIAAIRGAATPQHTFNILALQQMGQHTELFNGDVLWGKSLSWWAFLLLFWGFAIKVPAFPVHTWLPDAHVEAPTPISMILAGVLLKMGGYGIIRMCYPICPQAGYDLALMVCGVGVISMVYGAFAALAQKDLKRLVAYSSVSHMGYVTLGLGVWSAVAGTNYNPDYWAMGVAGAMFQMIAHGVSSPGMFFMVGVVYDRVHHRNIDEFGGLFGRMPLYTALAIVVFFAGLGLPGLCGFIGEVLVTLSVWNYSQALTVISASVVILTAAYILWMIQRVYLGPEYKGPHGDHLTPMTLREVAIAVPLVVFAVIFGVFPQTVLQYVQPTVSRQVGELADWTRRHDKAQPPITAAAPGAEENLAAR
ncbi:MAG: NADH-quinone oxidoreductase subunit M [Pirellulales bacterium]